MMFKQKSFVAFVARIWPLLGSNSVCFIVLFHGRNDWFASVVSKLLKVATVSIY